MRDALPDSIDPRALARQAVRLQGCMPVTKLQRLPGLVRCIDHEPRVDLRFGIDTEHQPYVDGRVGVTVSVTCQRCLEPCELVLEADFRLGITATEQEIDHLAVDYEPLIAGATLVLADLVEDELLLVFPAFPRHPEGDCRAACADDPAEVVEIETRRPFAELGALWWRDPSKSS